MKTTSDPKFHTPLIGGRGVLVSTLLATSMVLAGCMADADSPSHVQSLASSEQEKQRTVRAGLVDSLAPAEPLNSFGKADDDRSFQSELQFLETVLSYGPPADPRYAFLMVNFYLAANQQEYGIAFLEQMFARYGNRMRGDVRASYLAAHAILRATYAERVPLARRIVWVLDTFALLDEAEQLASEDNPLVHWSAGLIYAQVPWFFGKRDEALAELTWLSEHPQTEPTSGFYREAYRQLAKLHAEDGDADLAARFLSKSGYDAYQPSAMFMGWFTTTKEKGLTFAATPWLEEVVPDRVFALRGFGFSEVHFVITEDTKELIAIDAGTQPFSMEAAYNYLKERRASLPPLTTAIITHAHWDHIGGYTFLKRLNPAIKIYGRGNFHGTLERVRRKHSYQQFRSAAYEDAWVKDYRPDIAIDELTEITLGGTVFELVPVTGGETEDALLIHLSKLGVLFVGDTMMPFNGEPWVEEGFVDEAVPMMDEIIRRNPKHVLHGHYGLTFLYQIEAIRVFRGAYAWLVDAAKTHVLNGYSVKDIVRLNLIPPGLENHPEAFLGYLSPRNHIIARVADQLTGIWQEDRTGKEPAGLDTLTSVEYGRLLERYLELSESDVERTLRRILDAGDNELALQLAVAAENRYQENEGIVTLKQEAADRLRSVNQFFDPFKFVVYTELIGKEHKPIPEGRVQ